MLNAGFADALTCRFVLEVERGWGVISARRPTHHVIAFAFVWRLVSAALADWIVK